MTLGLAGAGGGAAPIPGLSSDGANGIDVQGAVAIKGAQSGGPAMLGVGADGVGPYNAQFYVGANGEVNVHVLDSTFAVTGFFLSREKGARFTYGGALLKFVDFSGENQPLLEMQAFASDGSTLVGQCTVGKEGGIGAFSSPAPTAPRTLTQVTITAITDANAKAAVQACANALADMGVLTLT